MPYRCLIFLYLFFIPLASFADFLFSDQSAIQLIILNKKGSLPQRIARISATLLGASYQSGALGEGPGGEYDRNPLYRFDQFDCETYVDTVIALSLANNFLEFKKNLNQIRYKRSYIDFFQRNHFPSADWIPNNKRKGYIQELTYRIAGQKTRITRAVIHRRSWYQHLTLDRIQIPYLSTLEKKIYLNELKKKGRNLLIVKK